MKKLIAYYLTVSIILVFIFPLHSYADILACYKENTGQLRVVADLAECLPSEEPIVISQNDPIPISIERLCYDIYDNVDDTEAGPFDLTIELMLVGNQYHLQGYVTNLPDGSTSYVSGSGALINGEIVIVSHSSHDHPQMNYRDAGTGQFILSADKSSGDWWETGVDYSAGISETYHNEGYIEQKECP